MLSEPVRCSLPCASAGSSPCTALISPFDKSAHVALFGTADAAMLSSCSEAEGNGCRAVCRALCVSLLEAQASAASTEQSRSVNVVRRIVLDSKLATEAPQTQRRRKDYFCNPIIFNLCVCGASVANSFLKWTPNSLPTAAASSSRPSSSSC